MAGPGQTGCPQCQRLRARVAELEAQLAAARKHSGNSSKPPSSDIVKPPKPPRADGQKRRQGAQPGHAKHERPAFTAEQLTAPPHDYTLEHCPDCGGSLDAADAAPRVLQHVDIKDVPLHIEEHRSQAAWCQRCHKLHYAALPADLVRAGLTGPKLTALVGYLKGACHASFSTIRKFLRDVVKVTVSRGQLAKLIQKVSASLAPAYEDLLAALPHEDRLNVDETGHPDRGERLWTWCFRAALYTLFRIKPTRGAVVLVEVLGEEFDGLLGCDYFSAYRKYMKDFGVKVQFCLAHLIRDIKFLVGHPDAANRRYGAILLEHFRSLFGVIHRRDDFASDASFRRRLAAVRNELRDAVLDHLPQTREAGNLADRLAVDLASYFRFITEPDVEPTNNLAEQAIRFVAIHRRLTQGTRGTAGQQWCERMWTVVVSCGQQGRSVYQFLVESVQASFQGSQGPSLLPDTT